MRLIPSMEVAPECLGLELEARIGEASFTIALPVHDGQQNSAVFLPPPSASEALRAERWDGMDPWAGEHRMTSENKVLSYAIHKVVLFGSPSGETNSELAVSSTRLGNAVDSWYGGVYAWLELWTTQGLNQDQWPETGIRTEGTGTAPDGRPYGWGDWNVIRRYSGGGTSGPYASNDLLRAAIELSNCGHRPSLPWDMLRRARGLRPTDGRQKVIDAATAAEIAVERKLFRYFNERHMNPDQIDATLKPFTGIAEKLRLLEKLIPPSTSLVNRVADRIAGPRNKAAHAGWYPDQHVVEKCVEMVADILAVYDPLPQASDPGAVSSAASA
jgi:hypothetical protein